MTKIGKPNEPPKPSDKTPAEERAKTPSPPPSDDDYEDGDIATPKRDDCGPDDEPL